MIKKIKVLLLVMYSGCLGYYCAENFRLADSVALENPIGSIFANPAGLSSTKVPEVLLTYNIMYPKLTDGTKFTNNGFGVIQGLLGGAIGLGFNQFGVIDWYMREQFVLSYGRTLRELLSKLSLGLKIMYVKDTYSLDEYLKTSLVFAKGNNISFLSISLGAKYLWNEILTIGISLDNINQPEVGFYTKEKVPLYLKSGIKYQYKNLSVYPNLNVYFSEYIDFVGSVSFDYKIYILKKRIKIVPSLSLGYGNRNYNEAILGFGVYTNQISINYGYSIPFISKIDTGSKQCISLSYKFLPLDLEEAKVSKKEYEKLLSEKQKLEEEIKILMETPKDVSQKVEETKKENTLQPQQDNISTEEALLKKLEELERRLKESETKRVLEEKPKLQVQPSTTSPQVSQPVQKKRYHTVEEGDTLPKLAEKYYGDANQWRKIYEANKDKIIRGQIIKNSILEIP
ncbi:MAG: LysM peptidoglycan-binding domain-containing protein [Endomicrobia bacterium]|nr:LysM peptidoglycan-binding domain-containing protein [Endomicrobiia bacterium]